MKALTWHGKRDVRVDTVPDPTIEQPTDAIIRVTSTGLCGSDLHLYEVLGPFLEAGDVLGHEPMGIVEAVGSGGGQPRGRRSRRRARSTSPAGTASCASTGCRASARRRRTATRAWAPASSATRSSTARCRAARRSCCGCRRPTTGRSRSPRARPTTASCSSPTCCPRRGRPCSTRRSPTAAAWPSSASGPIGEMSTRIAQHLGAGTVIGLDLVPERLARSKSHGVRDDRRQRRRRRAGGRARADRRPRAGRGHRRRRAWRPTARPAASWRTRSPG